MIAIYIGPQVAPHRRQVFSEHIEVLCTDESKLLVYIPARFKSSHDIHIRERYVVPEKETPVEGRRQGKNPGQGYRGLCIQRNRMEGVKTLVKPCKIIRIVQTAGSGLWKVSTVPSKPPKTVPSPAAI